MALKQEREVSQAAVDRAVEKTRESVQQKMEDIMKVSIPVFHYVSHQHIDMLDC